MAGSEKSARRALQVMLLGSLILVAFVFRPFGAALFLAAVLSMVSWPLHQWLTAKLRGHGGVAAGILVACVVALVIGPLVGLSAFLVAEAADAVRFVSETVRSDGTRGLVAKLPDSVEHFFLRTLDRLDVDLAEMLKSFQQHLTEAGGTAAAALGAAVSATGSLVLQGTMMIIALFFILTNKDGLMNWLDEASPLRRGQTRELFGEFVRVCKSVIVSAAATALVQAVAALVGYFIASVPHPFFFFAVTFIVAFIPAAGASSICLLAAGLRLLSGHPWMALFLAIYAIVVVGLVDNVVKPLLMKDDIQMHGAVVFFALLGGLAAFGAMGLLIGPLAVALFLAMLRIYKRDYSEDPGQRDALREQGVGSTRSLEPGAAPP
ncbi:MAG TPA: AI-2E family transporter [Polyangiaceae bacterium]|nr:AI-2E family transporter [Polyangiaceae bacterium]